MFVILLHSSKTMRVPVDAPKPATDPEFSAEAKELTRYLRSLGPAAVAKTMGISAKLARKTLDSAVDWSPKGSSAAIDTFVGDIYSGLQAGSFSANDRAYAQKTLVILSGLYGLLRPLDAVDPYRFEIGYHFPDVPYNNLYKFWGDRIARALPVGQTIINTSSAEYTKAILPFLSDERIITPKFLTISPKTGEPTFVTVHAKIARGAFARWLIVNQVEDEALLKDFDDLGYIYDPSLSTPTDPVFVAKTFSGLGLSVRLT